MEKVVYKYTLPLGRSEIWLPPEAEIVHVHEQHGQICMWVLESTGPSTAVRIFEVKGTGTVFDSEGLAYIGTVHSDPFVWHIFERVN